MNTITLLILGLFILTNGAVIFLLFKRQTGNKQVDGQNMQMLNQNIQGMQERLDKVSQGLNDRLDSAARVIGAVNKELGSLQEIGRNMQGLQEFLKSPKLRGNVGEQVLKQMLGQFFPTAFYSLQYKFRAGQIVDAVLKTEDGLIPIDSKFPMENYQKMIRAEIETERVKFLHEFLKDVKKHVNDIAKKYILPAEGTINFAVMYIPSESVYYEIIRDDLDLNRYSMEKKVLFVSPNSFFYFLRVIMMGMQGKKMAEATREIIDTVRGLQKDTHKFADSLNVLNTHITHTKSAFDRVATDYASITGKIERLDRVDEDNLLE
ncbi:MAG: hypothetical protein A2233_00140 [Candidatus Kerfeldbacteria bacterium RIFOXYA2_FULL_38_24]|uniref:DNA recombination protein RmuC n=1 Tax=Candidatus Kerfeldbacteria bacterium RIFOXYB2_FULL_38_14 TaxID=1798547 RepID=A0A1G2B9Y3_9BACT|nr:MAG: hypothetical protein A2233_00140 [Candidatus Kerfeldbacteria bacterium RIFOXYA2_FULL_38_24]OGY86004.1 MAG: hypothetical protein A2319_00345 [Candidatus Kerfeldbacteria bacterium RIFOXYB2_FULL_38_14]OGY90115.1 MAG: hypothetical protein A2458_03940 [Candidatus Kerfeldbacteria bacterium RIFOXYC2_FULL_38_9]